ncbi:Alpha/Beta hydrolase protein [Phaeosphaeria sp. MPI-PUGE-AT-0046c]|nr:Alpha/Beta hydrolase protein [Phaeosphaeria sp. MPI-PUGE-AT-0046c]
MTSMTIKHTNLGSLNCLHDNSFLTRILGLPYATIPHRFARSKLCLHPKDHPSSSTRFKDSVFDATSPGPASIQPFGSIKSDASNIPLPTKTLPEDDPQSEDCLTLSIHLPPSAFHSNSHTLNENAKLPVLVFIHGGAFFLGSGNRPYYDPVSFLSYAIARQKEIIYISINYRLGCLGFLRAETSDASMPPNNGLYDQIRALEWIKANISAFGGDVNNITALGQSAGGESISLLTHCEEVIENDLFQRAVMFSGTPVTMPALTPDEHTDNFLAQAFKAGISTKNPDGSDRTIEDIVKEMQVLPVEKIRDLAWVGLPYTSTPLLPFQQPTMGMLRDGGPDAWNDTAKKRKEGKGVQSQLVSTTTYDGGISFNMMSRDSSRSAHGQAFINIAHDVLGHEHASILCGIYGVDKDTPDAEALQRICLFESDIGFFFAALAVASSRLIKDTYFHIFDLPDPFEGPLKSMGEFATHTFDILTLLGGYDQTLLPAGYTDVIAKWRDVVLDFVREGKAPCERFGTKEGGMVVDARGVRRVERGEYMHGRRESLMQLAEKVDAKEGRDVLWVDVCRRFLMKGK